MPDARPGTETSPQPPAVIAFQAGGTLPSDSPQYIERKADEVLPKALLAGEFCYVLTPRQMGKSSLMNRTMALLRAQGGSCVSVDVSAAGNESDAVSRARHRSSLSVLISPAAVTGLKSVFKDGTCSEPAWLELFAAGVVRGDPPRVRPR